MGGVEAIWGGLSETDLQCRWAPLVAVAESGALSTRSALTWVLLARGCKGFGWEQEGGEKKCPYFFVDRVTGLTPFFDVGCLIP